MAKFDKNIKNEFLDPDEIFEDEEDIFEDLDHEDSAGGSETETAEEEENSADYYEDGGADSESEPVAETSEAGGTGDAEPAHVTAEDDGMQKDEKAHWYVVHTYSGHENKVKINIEKMVENRGMQDLIQCVVMPTEDVVEMKDGQRKVRTRKIFPGYVIVKMVMTSDSWYVIRNTQGVTGFVGHGSEPIPLTDDEVRHMGIDKVTYHIDLEAGDAVKVINGPFDNFMGYVDEVNYEKQTAKVRISMFGRETPVELEFGQVEKIQ